MCWCDQRHGAWFSCSSSQKPEASTNIPTSLPGMIYASLNFDHFVVRSSSIESRASMMSSHSCFLLLCMYTGSYSSVTVGQRDSCSYAGIYSIWVQILLLSCPSALGSCLPSFTFIWTNESMLCSHSLWRDAAGYYRSKWWLESSARRIFRCYRDDNCRCCSVTKNCNAMCSGVRPFGVSLLVAGYDDNGPQLYQVSSRLFHKLSGRLPWVWNRHC